MKKEFKPRWIVVHTAADPRENGCYDTTVAEIRSWHRARGWTDIGYHFVVHRDGRVSTGRSETVPGAHVQGANSVSLGICLSGHGDLQPPTDEQMGALIRQIVRLCKRYNIPASRVIGHREVGKINKSLITTKTCPGKKVNMDRIREKVAHLLEADTK